MTDWESKKPEDIVDDLFRLNALLRSTGMIVEDEPVVVSPHTFELAQAEAQAQRYPRRRGEKEDV